MNAAKLISFAWYLSGIVPRDLEEVSGSQGSDGLFWLNQILSEQSATGRYLIYYTHYEFDAVIGQEKYFIPGGVLLETATFNIGPVRYQMNLDNRRHYFGAPRVDNIQALPFNWYWETVVNGIDLYMYFLPQENFPIKLTGRFALTQVTNPLFEFDTVVDKFYQSYLLYLLAKRLCSWYKLTPPTDVEAQLKEFKNTLADRNYIDLTISKQSIYTTRDAITYAQANLGKGWTQP